ncbi:MAG: histidine kinase N-terminal 7TM domain-containing protein [Bacillota bacterium]
MKLQFNLYLIPLFTSSFITFVLALYSYKYRKVKGAVAFMLSMFAGSLWAAANALEMAGVSLSAKVFWANIQYVFYAFAPLIWLVMVFEFTEREELVNKKNIMLFSIIPLLTIFFVWTNDYHHLMRKNVSLDSAGMFSVIVKDYGIWFWIHFIYCYILNTLSMIFLLRAIWNRNLIYRRQTIFLFAGYGIVFLSNILYVLGISPITRFDISPVLFSLSAAVIALGIFRFRIFDLVPVARTTIFEEMATGIIAFDRKKRIIDINPRIKNMFFLDENISYLGKRLSSITPELENIFDSIDFENKHKFINREMKIKFENESYYYELFLSLIENNKDRFLAGVMIINDITALKEARKTLNRQEKELAVMDERQRLARDLHDNLGQVLSFSGVQIQAARQQFKKENYNIADQYLKRLSTIIRDAHKDIREYVYNVRDNSRYKHNFLELLEEEIVEFKEKSEISVELKTNFKKNKDDISENIIRVLRVEEKIQLINIVREALTNILKYAEAEKVKIISYLKDKKLKLIIEDNGIGIDQLKKNKGSGINIMYERAKIIGGSLKIESEVDKGCRITVLLPVGEE